MSVKNSLWPVLGAIRFFLSMVVVSNHFLFIPSHVFGPISLHLNLLSGSVAVACFLVVSGFSIGASYEREQSMFYLRRALRIVPLYVLFVLASVAISYLPGLPEHIKPIGIRQTLGNLFFLQGFAVKTIATDGALWSISIEVFFYAVTPILAKSTTKALVWFIGISAVAFVAYDWFSSTSIHVLIYGVNVLFLGWLWVGGFLAYRLREKKHLPIVLVSGGILIISLNRSFAFCEWAFTWTVTSLAIAYGAKMKIGPRLADCFSILGDISYPLYLLHIPMFLILGSYFNFDSELPFFAFTVGAAYVLDRIYDKPIKLMILATVRCLKSNKANSSVASLPEGAKA